MKIKVNKNELLKGLTYCSSIIPSKVLVESLECVLFSIKDKKITMRTSSMSTEVAYKIDVLEDVEVECLIPCILFLNSIKLIREEEIQLTFKKKEENNDFIVEVKSKKGRSKIQSHSSEGFPPSKSETTEFKEYITFKNNEGINELKNALGFVKVEDLRPSLSCLNISVKAETLTVVGMNGISGAMIDVNIHNSFGLETEISIKKDVVDNLFKTMPSVGSKFYFNDKMFMVKSSNVTFVGDNYTEIKYPKIKHLFENKGEGLVHVSAKEIKDSILRVVNFGEAGDNGFRLVGFDIEDDYSKVLIHSENYSGSSEEVNDVIRKEVNFVKKENDALRSKLNSIYLLKILDSTEGNVIVNFFNIDGVYNKAIHISVGGETAEDMYVKQFIIMPSI